MLLTVVPFPSCPLALFPQQYARPAWIVHACALPAAIAAAGPADAAAELADAAAELADAAAA